MHQGWKYFSAKPLAAAICALLTGYGLSAVAASHADSQTMVVTATSSVANEDSTNAVAHNAATASKTDLPIGRTPQSVAVVTQAQIADQAARTVPEALRYLSGVNAETSGADSRFDTILVRGFEADEYLDGLRLPKEVFWSRPQWDPFLLSRIEVVKGPSSVLYGQANPGGIVNLVSKKPQAQPGGQVYITGGNHYQFGTGFDVTGPLTDDKVWLGRVAGTFFNTKTQVEHTRYEHFDIAPSLTWQPNDRTTLTLLGQLRRDPQSGFFNQQPVRGTLVNNPNGNISSHFYGGQPGLDSYAREQASIGWQFQHQFNDHVLFRQNARYLSTTADYKMVYPTSTLPDAPEVNRGTMNLSEDTTNEAIDNQVQLKGDTGPVSHTLLAGVDYMHTSYHRANGFGVTSPINYLDPDYSTPVALPDYSSFSRGTMKQLGTFLQEQAEWNNWLLSLGGRYDDARTDVRDLVADSHSRRHDHATTGRAALLYHFDNGLAPYVSYSTSFVPTSGSGFDGNAFKPTKGKQSEIGLKYDPIGLDALFTLALFDLRETNVTTADPEHINYSVQTGEIRSRGIELDGKINVTPDWLVLGSWALTDPKVMKSNDGNQGNKPVAIARNTARPWSQYSLHGMLEGLSLGGGVRYIGTSYANVNNSLKVPAATVYDARVAWQWSNQWQVALNATNLTNKTYLAACQDNGCEYALKRQYIATLSYQW